MARNLIRSYRIFKPYLDRPLFFNDILGNTTVADLMSKLMENIHTEATGLAFDGTEAKQRSVDGFEFKFVRDDEKRRVVHGSTRWR